MLSSKIAINREEFVLLREYIQQECGIVVGDEKVYLIESRLARLVVETGSSSFKEFYLKAKSDITKKLRDKIVDAMTTNETLWFRDMKPWTIIKEILIPKFFDDLKSGRKQKITVWSAACSTGQEPYSLAMLLDEAMRKDPVSAKTSLAFWVQIFHQVHYIWLFQVVIIPLPCQEVCFQVIKSDTLLIKMECLRLSQKSRKW